MNNSRLAMPPGNWAKLTDSILMQNEILRPAARPSLVGVASRALVPGSVPVGAFFVASRPRAVGHTRDSYRDLLDRVPAL